MLSQWHSIKFLEKKKTYLAALQTQWDTFRHAWPLGCPQKQLKNNCKRVICKVRKIKHISKVRFRKKKNLQKCTLTVKEGRGSMKLQKPSIFVVNWVSPCLLFLKRLHCYYIFWSYLPHLIGYMLGGNKLFWMP